MYKSQTFVIIGREKKLRKKEEKTTKFLGGGVG